MDRVALISSILSLAQRQGVACDDAEVLWDGANVVLRLGDSLVARVATTTAAARGDRAGAAMRRSIVVAFTADCDAQVGTGEFSASCDLRLVETSPARVYSQLTSPSKDRGASSPGHRIVHVESPLQLAPHVLVHTKLQVDSSLQFRLDPSPAVTSHSAPSVQS